MFFTRLACKPVCKPTYISHWHAELGADGKDYRADFVHAPFPKILSSRVPLGLEVRGAVEAPLGFRARARAFEYSPHRNHEAVS